jgi:hypothetical protein
MLTVRVRQLIKAMPTEELATNFVLMTTGTKRPSRLYRSQDLLDELDRRVGAVQLQVEIQQAREALTMMGLTDVKKKAKPDAYDSFYR